MVTDTMITSKSVTSQARNAARNTPRRACKTVRARRSPNFRQPYQARTQPLRAHQVRTAVAAQCATVPPVTTHAAPARPSAVHLPSTSSVPVSPSSYRQPPPRRHCGGRVRSVPTWTLTWSCRRQHNWLRGAVWCSAIRHKWATHQ